MACAAERAQQRKREVRRPPPGQPAEQCAGVWIVRSERRATIEHVPPGGCDARTLQVVENEPPVRKVVAEQSYAKRRSVHHTRTQQCKTEYDPLAQAMGSCRARA